jgi:hypothetical protein
MGNLALRSVGGDEFAYGSDEERSAFAYHAIR